MESRRHYVRALGVDARSPEWVGGDPIPQYNLSPGQPALMLHMLSEKLETDHIKWGYCTPEEAAEKKKPWICARVEKALTGRYFRHMFSRGRVIIPGGGRYEWSVEGGKKQPWYISRRTGEPIFMAGITNWKLYTNQKYGNGFRDVTEDSDGGMVDIHFRRPIVLAPSDAWLWMDPQTSVEEAAHIARSRSIPNEEFMW